MNRIFYIALLVIFSTPAFAQRIVYDIHIAENVQANYQRLAIGRPDTSGVPASFSDHFDNSYHLVLSLTVLSVENNFRLLQGNITVKTISIKRDNQEDQRRAALFMQSVAEPFYCKMGLPGNIYAIQTAANSTAAFTNFLRDLLSQLQMVLPENGAVDQSWSVNQEYPDGISRVRYEPAGSSFTRTIQAGDGDSVIAWENTLSRTADQLMPGKIIFHKKFYQKLGTSILALVDRSMEATAHFEASKREELQRYISVYRQRSTALHASNIFNPVSEEKRKALISQGVLKKDNYESLISQLPSATKMDNEQFNLLISKFRSLLYLYPQYMEPILQRLLQTNSDQPAFSILSAALVEVDTETAQDALAKLMDKYKNDWSVLQKIIPALGLRKYLSGGLLKTLLALRLQSDHVMIAGSAGLALSNLCRSIGEKQPRRADSIMQQLVQQYMTGEKDKSAISRFLNETGNAGYEKAHEENERYLHDEDIDIRLRAWCSLRLFKNEKTDGLLAEGLLQDTTAAVQQRILNVIYMRPAVPIYLDGVMHVLKVTANTETIEIALGWLKKYMAAFPAASGEVVKSIPEKYKNRLTD